MNVRAAVSVADGLMRQFFYYHLQRVTIKHAFARLKEEHDFDKNQLNWLKRIESTLLQESVLDVEMFNEGAFKTNGGFSVIDRRFDGKLKDILAELNGYIYDDESA